MRWPLIRFLPSNTHVNFVRLAPFAAVLSALALVVPQWIKLPPTQTALAVRRGLVFYQVLFAAESPAASE